MPLEFQRDPLKPYEYAELRTVYLRPMVSIGSIRIFSPIFVFLSKLITPDRGQKGNQDLLDVERLLTADEEGLELGLDDAKLKSWLDKMKKVQFKKVEDKVREWCKPDGSSMRQARVMSKWKLQQLKFPRRWTSRSRRRSSVITSVIGRTRSAASKRLSMSVRALGARNAAFASFPASCADLPLTRVEHDEILCSLPRQGSLPCLHPP